MAYMKDGIEYPSVTTILGMLDKPALKFWAANCAVDFISERIEEIQNPSGPHVIEGIMRDARRAFETASGKAKDIGTAVHEMIHAHIHNAPIPEGVPPEAETGFLAFLEWEQKNAVVWLESELTLFSTLHGYSGTTDVVAEVNAHRYLMDFKSSKDFYPEYQVQCAAYLQALREEYSEQYGDVENIGILRLDKETGAPEFRDVTCGWTAKAVAFNKLTEYYYSAQKRRLKNNPWVEKYWGKTA